MCASLKRPFFVLALSVLPVASCGGESADDTSAAPDVAVEPDTALPPSPSTLDYPVDASGPFGVGYRTFEHTYVPSGASEARTIPVHVWYPSPETEGEHPMYIGTFPDDVSVIDAPASDPVSAKGYPVHLHSHGHQGFAGTSANLMRWFASHGWVAIAPDHIGDLIVDSATSGTLAHYLERPQDVSQALDALEQLPEGDPLAKADTSRVLLSGHSRGTYTVWATAGSAYDVDAIKAAWPEATAAELAGLSAGFGDPRVAAGMPMAGTYREEWFGKSGFGAVTAPMLALTGSEDGPDGSKAQWEALDGIELTWVELAGGCHQTFALGFCDTLTSEVGFSIVNTYALAFARAHVLGDTGETTLAILDGTAQVAAEATLMRKGP